MRILFTKPIFLLVMMASLLGVGSLVDAQTVEELQQKITAQTSAINKLEKEIEQYQGDLTVLASKKKTLKNAVATLEITRKKLETDIKITQTKVDTTDLKIRQLGSDIQYKEDEVNARITALREAIIAINESDKQSLPQVALSDGSFSDFWNDLETLGQFSDSVNTDVDRVKALKLALESQNKKQQAEKGKLLNLKSDLGDQKKITEDNKKQTTKLLTQTSSQESQYQKILKSKLAQKDALEKELHDYESTLKFILDPSSIPPRGTKVFSPPLDSVYITQNFGKTSASGRLYASGTHNGTDFRASVGTPVKAMLAGTIVGTGDTDLTCSGASFGRWILIDYHNGLAATYAHLSLIKVKAGDTVSKGQVVGYSGNTGYSTGPHLHISVYARKAVNVETRPSSACGSKTYTMPIAAINGYLDPLDYIKI